MSKEYIQKIEYKGLYITTMYDTDPMNPREEWENLGVMVCAHRRYRLGDRMIGDDGDVPYLDTHSGFSSWLDVQVRTGKVICLPLYLYDHGGVSISTRSWVGRAVHAEWDSGLVGYIYVTREAIFKNYGWKKLSSKRKNQILDMLRMEVEDYNRWMNGEVMGWQLWDTNPDEGEYLDNVIDSCWGYYEEQSCINDAMLAADSFIREELRRGVQLHLPDMEGHFQEEIRVEGERLDTAAK